MKKRIRKIRRIKESSSQMEKERTERILIVENDSSEFSDVARVIGSSVHIADADIVVVIDGDQGKVIKHRDRLPEEVDVMVARKSSNEEGE